MVSPSPTPGSPSDRAELIPRPDQPLPTGEAKVEAVRAMFDTIAPNYDKVNRIMTGRLQGDALALPFPDGSLDGVTCGFALRNFESLPLFLAELARVLRPGGRIGLLEVGQPSNPVLKAGFDVYFGKVVPKIGARFSDARAYAYLPRSVDYLPPPAETMRLIADAGFDRSHHRQLTGGLAQLFTATLKRS